MPVKLGLIGARLLHMVHSRRRGVAVIAPWGNAEAGQECLSPRLRLGPSIRREDTAGSPPSRHNIAQGCGAGYMNDRGQSIAPSCQDPGSVVVNEQH
jgi:hypothetical protein